MLSSELYKIVVNKDTFEGLKGAIAPCMLSRKYSPTLQIIPQPRPVLADPSHVLRAQIQERIYSPQSDEGRDRTLTTPARQGQGPDAARVRDLVAIAIEQPDAGRAKVRKENWSILSGERQKWWRVIRICIGPVAKGGFGGLSPSKQSSKPPQIKISSIINQWNFVKFECQAPPAQTPTPPRTNVKPPC